MDITTSLIILAGVCAICRFAQEQSTGTITEEGPGTFDPPEKPATESVESEETPGDEVPPEEIEKADAEEKVDDTRTEEASEPPVSEIPSFRPRPVTSRAAQIGMTAAEAKKFAESFDSPERANQALELMSAGVNAKRPKESEKPPAKATAPERVRFEVGQDEDIDPALAKQLDAAIGKLQDKYEGQIGELQKQLSAAGDQSDQQRRHEAQAQHEANVKQFDQSIGELGEEYHALVGEGPSSSLDMKSKERDIREQVFGIQTALEVGLTQMAVEVPSRKTLFKWAKKIVLDDEDTGITRTKLVKKLKKRGQQATGKPEIGRERELTKDERGIANVKKRIAAIKAGRPEE